MPKLSEVTAPKTLKLSQVQAAPAPQAPKPSLFRMDSDFRDRAPNVGVGDMLWAATRDMFGSRQGAAEYLAGQINEGRGLSSLIDGGAKVEAGEDGQPVLRLPDGTRYRMNDAGIDAADVANVAGNVAAAWMPASWAARVGQAKNLGLGARMGLQAATAAGTDAALQVGTEGRVDPQRTALVAAGGGFGELVGTGLGAIADRATKLLRTRSTRDAAMDLAREAGIPQPDPKVIERMVSGLDEIKAGADPRAILGREEFKFIYTQGQRMLDPDQRLAQLTREEALRNMPGSQETFARVGRQNAERLDEAISGISTRLGAGVSETPSELAQGAGLTLRNQADALRGQIDEAYGAVAKGGRTVVAADAVRQAPDRFSAAVRDFGVNPKLHPATSETLNQLRQAAAGLGKETKGVTLQALETQRRIINSNYGAAANPADRAAMGAIKREFDSFMDEAIEKALIQGDPAALEALKRARGLRAEFSRRFEGKGDTDRFIGGLLDGSRTPEEIVNMALGSAQVSKAGGARFIDRLKAASADDPSVVGRLRAAHFMRLARDRSGRTLEPGRIVSNIQNTEYSNGSILAALYKPEEWSQIRRLASSLEPMLPPKELAKTSGTGERLLRFLTNKMAPGLPIVGDTAAAMSGGVNAIKAGRAINQPIRRPVQALPGSVPAMSAIADEFSR